MRLEFTITTLEDKKLQGILEMAAGLPSRAGTRVVRAMERAGLEIVGKAVKERFTGQGPFPASQNKLGVRSGRLRRSIRSTRPQLNLRTGEISMSFGSNVVYFAIHEFGKEGAVNVKAHTRRLLSPGKPTRRGKLSKRYQEELKAVLAGRHFEGKTRRTVVADRAYQVKAGKTFAEVRAHKRKLKVPARAPLGTQLKHVSTRAAFLRNLRNQLQPLLRTGR